MTANGLAIVGPTAVGKSAVAVELCRRIGDLEMVSVDSMQVYRGMDIGTAKPTTAERRQWPVHLVDLVDPGCEFTVSLFQRSYRECVDAIHERGRRPLLVGGTGLYHRAVIDDLELPPQYRDIAAQLASEPDTEALHVRLSEVDPVAASRMEPTNRRRVIRALEVCLGSGRRFSSFGPGLGTYPASPIIQLGLDRSRDDLDQRISDRFAAQMDAGFLEEVRGLADRSEALSATAAQALGYRELLAALRGECSVDEAVELAISRTRRFARRQQRWFRRDPRVRWVSIEPGDNPVVVADRLLEDCLQCA